MVDLPCRKPCSGDTVIVAIGRVEIARAAFRPAYLPIEHQPQEITLTQ